MTGEESLFKLALSIRREIEPDRFENYFFDSSLVYVYLSQGITAFDFVTNLVHEVGHSFLANSPLGFLHQSLFELAATASDHLWSRYISENLARRLDEERYEGQRAEELTRLETVGSRLVPQRRAAREEATTLLKRSEEALTEALRQPAAARLVNALLHLYGRHTKMPSRASGRYNCRAGKLTQPKETRC